MDTQTTHTAHRSKGFNLIEAAIVLGVIGLVVGGIWVAASKVRSDMLANDMALAYVGAIKNVQNKIPASVPAGYIQLETVGPKLAPDMALFPSSWVKGQDIVTPYGGYVRIEVGTGNLCLGGGNGPYASIRTAVNPSECVKLLYGLINGRIDNLSIGINGSAIAGNNTLSWVSSRCSPTASSTLCLAFPLTRQN